MQKNPARTLIALVLGLVATLNLAATAQASLIDFEGSYDVAANSNDPGLVIETWLYNNGDLAFSLSEGGSYTTDLFDIWTDETYVNSDDQNPQDIGVAFSFTLPDAFGGTLEGQTVGGSMSTIFGSYQSGVVIWNNPAALAFGDGGILNVSLSNETFNGGFFGLSEGPGYGATVKGTFMLAQAPNAVPEPGALALFGFGLLGMGVVARRRQLRFR